ncbi:MAG: hypothetical protein ABSB40_11295 [Nitrososphaeria archaeon]|jgi:hypothetical protein
MKKMEEREDKLSSCTDVRDENGNVLGAVCVAIAKNFGKKRKTDIIFMGKEKPAFSVRSTTELMNILGQTKMNVSFEERKRVLNFVAERLRMLELERASGDSEEASNEKQH